MKGHQQSDGTAIDPEDNNLPPEGDFVSLFCGKFGCPADKFEKHVFLECVYPEGRDAARIMRLIYPGFFRTDFNLIEAVSHATSLEEFKKLVDFHAAQTSQQGGMRVLLNIRVSKQKLLKLAQTIFENPAPAPPPA